jgi:hypothetical protein
VKTRIRQSRADVGNLQWKSKKSLLEGERAPTSSVKRKTRPSAAGFQQLPDS